MSETWTQEGFPVRQLFLTHIETGFGGTKLKLAVQTTKHCTNSLA